MSEKSFLQDVLRISIPVALQSMLQSSFSMVDQIMVGQLGDKSVAAVEIAGKPSFIYAFVIGAISTITGIMISQYIGNKNREAEEKSICVNFLVMILTGLTFLSVFGLFRNPFVEMFTEEEQVIAEGSTYLGIISWTFIPLGICSILGTALRCRDKSTWPLYIGIFSAAQYRVKLLPDIWEFWRATSWNSRCRICECHIPGGRSTDIHPVLLQIIWTDSYFVKPWKGRVFAVLYDAAADCFE